MIVTHGAKMRDSSCPPHVQGSAAAFSRPPQVFWNRCQTLQACFVEKPPGVGSDKTSISQLKKESFVGVRDSILPGYNQKIVQFCRSSGSSARDLLPLGNLRTWLKPSPQRRTKEQLRSLEVSFLE